MSNQQVIVSILADTKKLQSGLKDANTKLGGLGKSVGNVTGVLKGLAVAFVATQVKDLFTGAIAEAEDAAKALAGANSVFGDTPGLLNKISADADKVGLALGKDNDEIINLATNLGARLSGAAKGLSVDLVAVGADVAAITGVDVETWTKKFSKAMIDGSLSTKEMTTSFPGLTEATYKQADAMFKAGDQAGALNVLIAESTKVNGDAAEKQVTATQKIDTIMADLSETIGEQLLPYLDGFTLWLEDAVKWVKDNKDTLIVLGTIFGGIAGAILAAKGAIALYNGIMNTWKTITIIATGVQAAFNAVMALNPFVLIVIAVIALVAALVYFFTQTELGKTIWKNFTKFLSEAWANVAKFFSDSWKNITKFFVDGFNGVLKFFGDFKKNILGILAGAGNWLTGIGKNVIDGLLNGLKNGFKAVTDFVGTIGNSVMGGIKKIFGIRSPSREMKKLGEMITAGLAIGLEDVTKIDKAVLGVSDSLSFDATANYNSQGTNGMVPIASQGGNTYNITVQAVSSNAEVGRAIVQSISEYERTSGRRTL